MLTCRFKSFASLMLCDRPVGSMWLIRSCYCNSNRLRVQKKKKKCQQIKKNKNIPLVLSQPTPVYHFFCQSVCLFCLCRRFCPSVSLFCHCRSTSRTAPLLPEQDWKFCPFSFFFFFYFRQMADSLMLSDLVSVVYCLAPGCFCQVTEQVNCDSYSMVCNGAALLFSSNRKAKLAGSQ